MKNKVLIATITFFFTIIASILFLNTFTAKTIKVYEINRKFSNDLILKFQNLNYKTITNRRARNVSSKKYICETFTFNNDEKTDSCHIFKTDYDFKEKVFLKARLPKNAFIVEVDSNTINYTINFKLFTHTIKTKLNHAILPSNLKIYSIKSLTKSNVIICFGEYNEKKNDFKTGFFAVNISSKQIKKLKIVETSKFSKSTINALRYSGLFNNSNESGLNIYTCSKYSKIYLFDENGYFLKELSTQEKIPLPTVKINEIGNSFFVQGSTFYTNKSCFVKDKRIFVFSDIKNNESIIIDEYDYLNLTYINSFKLHFRNLTTRDINKVFVKDNKVILAFNDFYASFIFSRYT